MIEIIQINDQKKWDEIIRSMQGFDFYHLNAYHKLENSGIPILFSYKDSEISFALPLIIRNIQGTDYKDVTSVYGYSGPLSKSTLPPAESLKKFQEALHSFFDEQHIVSAFSRLHPLISNQPALLKDMGIIEDANLTVGIDLTLPEELQVKQYSRSLRNRINHLKRIGVEIFQAKSQADVDAFIDIYTDNMKRVNAAESYFFPPSYFYSFVENIDSFILLASYQGKIISGTLFAECNNILHAHLNATKTAYLDLSPLKLVLDTGRKIGIEHKMHLMHLGGGLSGKNNSLFTFKSRFSKLYFTFHTWKYIHNKTIYDELVAEKISNSERNISFFPVYRANM